MVTNEEITRLVARHYELVQRDAFKDRDCHWEIAKA